MRRIAFAAVLSCCLTGTAAAQLVPALNSRPDPTPKSDTIPAARDIPYPGTIQLTVDASDVTRGIFKVRERIPVAAAGDLVLLYPKWLPGSHSPSGQISKIAGFRATANGRELDWVRDTLDVYAFHVAVPSGVGSVDVEFQYLSPTAENQGRIDLTPAVELNVVADNEEQLTATPAQIAAHKSLVDQAVKLFGAQHYDHYDSLLTISDNLGGSGLEHHRSSEDGVKRGYFTDWDNALRQRNLLAHEYTHSWDGKFRRGADLWTPDYRTPMQGSLLWVYEGQTQFWGFVLGARSGMLSKQDTLDALAATAASYSIGTPGHAWRPLVDTTNDPTISQRSPQAWRSWQRGEDYYSEGQLIWIDVDRILRQQSGGKRSIDDFARAFYGMRDRDYGELTYTVDDVAATLNRVQPYDWRAYLQRRVYELAAQAPLEGITQGGYRLIFTDQPTKWIKSAEKSGKNDDLTFSGGFSVGNDGKIGGVLWDSPAFNAGLTVGTELIAVNGRKFDGDSLKSAIKAAAGNGAAPELLIHDGDVYRTVRLDWHGGLRNPRLIRTSNNAGTLDALLAAR